MLRGAYDVIDVRSAGAGVELAARIEELAIPDAPPPVADLLVAESGVSKHAIAQAALVAATSMPVLLTGETGTGKEMMARTIHAWSERRDKHFVPINCAAIPNELMEAERSGMHAVRSRARSSVTTASSWPRAARPARRRRHAAGDAGSSASSKIASSTARARTSGTRSTSARSRPPQICVPHRGGLFGADLYERLAIVTIHLAPLRERLDDLPVLAAHFMARFAREQGRPPLRAIRADALRALAAYPWPGNIRELRNVLYQTLVYKRAGSAILLSDLPKRILRRADDTSRDAVVDRGSVTRKIARGTMNLRDEVAALERLALEEALARTGGNAARAAQLLGAAGRGAARDPGGHVRATLRRLARRNH